jgi:putative FmdB family regulatory protein
MPTYEYKCSAGHAFDKFYPTMNSSRRVKCPTCGKMAERQISGGAGLVFKGSGFYITDYKRAGEKREAEDTKPAAESKPGPESKPGSESTSSSESKPAADAKPAERTKKKKDSGDK